MTAQTIMCLLVGVLVFTLWFENRAHAAEISVGWIGPKFNTDGTPLTDLAGYDIHVGLSPGTTDEIYTVSDPTAESATFETTLVFQPGQNTVYLRAKAFDYAGNYSQFSNEVQKTINLIPADEATPETPILRSVIVSLQFTCPEAVTCVMVP